MSLIVPITMQTTQLQYLLSADLKLKLYANNYNPSVNSVIGAFTEVSGGGYAAITLASADWSYGTVSPVVATQAYKQFSFTGTTSGSGLVYGYYVTNTAGTVLYWAEALAAAVTPFTPTNLGYVRIVPRIAVSGGA